MGHPLMVKETRMLLARNASDAWGTPLIFISGAKVDIIGGLTKDLMI